MQAKLGVNYEGFSALIIYVASNIVLFGSLFLLRFSVMHHSAR